MKNNYLQDFLKSDPFDHSAKTKINFKNVLKKITKHHQNNSKKYKKYLNFLKRKNRDLNVIDLFLTTDAFKNDMISSISEKNILKKVQSSGTSSQLKSKIILDKQNSFNQRIVLGKIISTILGNSRLPMIILESKKLFFRKDKDINAKIAAINGFSNFGKDHFFLLNNDKEIDIKGLKKFVSKYKYKKIFIFGFTFDVYNFLVKTLEKKLIKDYLKILFCYMVVDGKNLRIKKFQILYLKIFEKLKIKKIYNYYGMIEQAGSIFLECSKCNNLRNSIFSDIFVRNKNLKLEEKNKKGIIQILSLLPLSYPGHNLLTSDEGMIIDCSCNAKCFKILGRVKDSEIRGCSNI